jgi:uncharacterized coiled-coil protein SlyX
MCSIGTVNLFFADMPDQSDRILNLETHVAQLERQVEQLNEVLFEQSRDLDRLRKNVNKLVDSVENAEMERIKSTNQKPPHYQ